MDKTTSSKQTRPSHVRKEIETPVIFRMLFAYVSLESIRTHECSRINYVVFSYSELFITNVTPCLLRAVPKFSFGLLCIAMDCSFLLRPCSLIWKRKQHTFGTFGQVNKNCSFSRVRNAFSGLSLSNRINEAKNKLSSRQRNPSLYEPNKRLFPWLFIEITFKFL